jgi:hypothetical protein
LGSRLLPALGWEAHDVTKGVFRKYPAWLTALWRAERAQAVVADAARLFDRSVSQWLQENWSMLGLLEEPVRNNLETASRAHGGKVVVVLGSPEVLGTITSAFEMFGYVVLQETATILVQVDAGEQSHVRGFAVSHTAGVPPASR